MLPPPPLPYTLAAVLYIYHKIESLFSILISYYESDCNFMTENHCRDKMGNDFQKFTEDKLIKQARNDFEKTVKALRAHNKTVLEEYLIQLDDSKKVVCDEPRNRALAEQVELYTREILREVEQLDPRFKNTFLQSGSFYDEVKVGLPDEYDYMAKLELLSIPGTAKAVPTKLGFARVILEHEETIDLWKEFLCDHEDSDEDIDEHNEEVFENLLAVSKVQEEFRSLVMKAIKSVKMPKKWQRNPCPTQHGPCTMLEFLVDDFLPEGQLYISIDLAPCMTYPKNKDVEFPFYKNLNEEGSFALLLAQLVANKCDVLLVPFINDGLKLLKNHNYLYRQSYREQMRVSFSLVEKDTFAHFTSNSVEKRVLRLLKILRDIHLRDDGKQPEWEEPYPEGPPSTRLQVNVLE